MIVSLCGLSAPAAVPSHHCPPTTLAFSLFLSHAPCDPASGPLHLLLSSQNLPFPTSCLGSSLTSSGLCSNLTRTSSLKV